MNAIRIDNTIQRILTDEKHRLELVVGRKVTMNEALRQIMKYGVVYNDYRLL